MELTGLPLLILVWMGALGATVALVRFWRRLSGRLVAVRAIGILLCEALLLFAVGAAVNRDGQFYPSWSALVGGGAVGNQSARRAANLTPWLQTRAAEGRRDGLIFPWQPTDEPAWRLDQPPTIYLPPAYFRDADVNLPVVLALAPPGLGSDAGGWDDPGLQSLAHRSDPSAVVVFLRVGTGARLDRLAAQLPDQLAADLRATGHGWAVIGVGTDAKAALALAAADPTRYGPVALVDGGSYRLGPDLLDAARRSVGSQLLVDPAASADAAGPGPGPAASAGSSVNLRHQRAGDLPPVRFAAALDWVQAQLPPPLAPPEVVEPLPTSTPSPLPPDVVRRPAGTAPLSSAGTAPRGSA